MSDPFQSPERFSSTRRGCLRFFVFAFIILCVLSSAAAVLLIRHQAMIRDSGVRLADANPDLNIVRRYMLQNYLAQNQEKLPEPAGQAVNMPFLIPPGISADSVAADLQDAGLLNNPELFLNYLIFYGMDSHLQAGQYTLNGNLTIPQLAEAITEGSAQDVTISFLKGLRLEEMADYLAVTSPAEIDSAEFLALARREQPFDLSPYPFLNSLGPNNTLEGYLFPGVYRVPSDADAQFLIEKMLQNFNSQVMPAMRQAYGAQGLSLADAVTLASIVERETPEDEERPLIASVYINRIREGMPLQADPTVQYALGFQTANQNWWKAPLYLSDLELEHPYNTYKISGLPPGPIANPGLASLLAVAEPAESDYLFFVLDCESNPPGRHTFSRTFEEHLANVERCR
ncbi:MAG: endolytic transglycosylase MltG [Candidatus Promineifilaceae bacterium]|jgi:UPF0755 protein